MATQPGVPSLLRVLNDRSTLELLLTDGATTRADLGRRTGLSRVTASQSLARLRARGLVEVDLRVSGVGASVASVTGETLATVAEPAGTTSNAELVVCAIDSVLGKASVARDEVSAVVVGVPCVVNSETDHVARIAPVHPRVVPSAVGESAVLTGATQRAVRTARRELLAGLDGDADD